MSPLLSPLANEIAKDRPVAWWPCQDIYADPNNVPKEAYGRFTLSRPGSGFSFPEWTLVRGDARFMGIDNNGGYLAGPTGSPFSSHAGASGVMSFEVLLRPGALSNGEMVFTKGRGSNYEYDLQAPANGAATWSMYLLNGSGAVAQVAAPAGTLVVGVPILLGGTYDRAAGQIVMYVNGREIARSTTFSGNTSAGAAVFQIGHREDNGGTQYWGGFGHFQIYDRVLSAGRFASHAQAARRGSPRTPPLMVG